MGKVNACLKRSYITVTCGIGIFSALLLALTLFSHGYLHEDEEIEEMISGIHGMYVMSIITLLLAIIGVYGASKLKAWALILFVVGMILSSLFLLACEIQGLLVRPEIAREIKSQYLQILPLSNASEAVLDSLKDVQVEKQCCGLDQGYMDWGYNISDTCLCVEDSTNPCVAAPRDSVLFEDTHTPLPIMIYEEPCLQYIIMHEINVVNAVLFGMMGLTLVWVMSVVLSILLLCQLNRKEDNLTVVYSPEAKAGNYVVLADAVEYTSDPPVIY